MPSWAVFTAAAAPPKVAIDKSTLVRDALVFQLKLFIDGIRDLVLIPVAFIAALISLAKSGDKAGTEFYEVVAFGRETERKIDLFAVADKLEPDADVEHSDVDRLVNQVEELVSRELQGERLSATRERLQALLARLQNKAAPADPPRD